MSLLQTETSDAHTPRTSLGATAFTKPMTMVSAIMTINIHNARPLRR